MEALRLLLANKRKTLATRLLELLIIQLREQLDDVLTEFLNIENKLNEEPRNIEDIVELREYMESIPLKIQGLENIVKKLGLEYEILDEFLCNIPDEDFRLKWQAFAYPLQIIKQVCD